MQGADWVTGVAIDAINLDRVQNAEEYLTCPDPGTDSPLDLTNAFTLEAWINPDSMGNYESIIHKDEAYVLQFAPGDDGYLRGAIWSNSGLVTLDDTQTQIQTGIWTHVAFTYDQHSLRLYVNGKLTASTPYNGLVDTNENPVYIGKNPRGNGWFYDGRIDEVQISNIARTTFNIYDYKTEMIPYGPDDGTVALYHLDEGSGTVLTDASGKHPLTLPTAWGYGKFGSGLDLSSDSKSYIDLGTSPAFDITDKITLEAWINPHSMTDYAPFIMKKNAYVIQFSPNGPGLLRGAIYQKGGGWQTIDQSQDPLSTDQWSLVAFTYDGSYMRLYVNGNLVAEKAQTGKISTSSDHVYIGRNTIEDEYYYNGLIDEVRITNTARAAQDFDISKELVVDSNTVALYHMNENSGNTVADATGSHDGTLVYQDNAPTWTSGKFDSGLDFNPANHNMLEMPDNLDIDFTNAFTLEAWINPDTAGVNEPLFNKQDSINFRFLNGQCLMGAIFSNGDWRSVIDTTTPIPTHEWTHVAFSYDGHALRLYVNGVNVQTTLYSGAITTNSNPLIIGYQKVLGTYYSGLMDEVRISSVARTDLIAKGGWFESTDISTYTAISSIIANPTVTLNGQSIQLWVSGDGGQHYSYIDPNIMKPNDIPFETTLNEFKYRIYLYSDGYSTPVLSDIKFSIRTYDNQLFDDFNDNAWVSELIDLNMQDSQLVVDKIDTRDYTTQNDFNGGTYSNTIWSSDGISGIKLAKNSDTGYYEFFGSYTSQPIDSKVTANQWGTYSYVTGFEGDQHDWPTLGIQVRFRAGDTIDELNSAAYSQPDTNTISLSGRYLQFQVWIWTTWDQGTYVLKELHIFGMPTRTGLVSENIRASSDIVEADVFMSDLMGTAPDNDNLPQLHISNDCGDTWNTVTMEPYYTQENVISIPGGIYITGFYGGYHFTTTGRCLKYYIEMNGFFMMYTPQLLDINSVTVRYSTDLYNTYVSPSDLMNVNSLDTYNKTQNSYGEILLIDHVDPIVETTIDDFNSYSSISNINISDFRGGAFQLKDLSPPDNENYFEGSGDYKSSILDSGEKGHHWDKIILDYDTVLRTTAPQAYIPTKTVYYRVSDYMNFDSISWTLYQNSIGVSGRYIQYEIVLHQGTQFSTCRILSVSITSRIPAEGSLTSRPFETSYPIHGGIIDYYGWNYHGTYEVQVSNDNGTTWVQVQDDGSFRFPIDDGHQFKYRVIERSSDGVGSPFVYLYDFTLDVSRSCLDINYIEANGMPVISASVDQNENPIETIFDFSSSVSPDDTYSYSWDFGDGQTSIDQSPSHEYMDPGFYNAKVTVQDISSSIYYLMKASDTIGVTVTPKLPDLSISNAGNDFKLCDPAPIVGRPCPVKVTVYNKGSVAAENTLVGLYYKEPMQEMTLIQQNLLTLSIPVDGSQEVNFIWTPQYSDEFELWAVANSNYPSQDANPVDNSNWIFTKVSYSPDHKDVQDTVFKNDVHGLTLVNAQAMAFDDLTFENDQYGAEVNCVEPVIFSNISFNNNDVGLTVTGGQFELIDSTILSSTRYDIVLDGGHAILKDSYFGFFDESKKSISESGQLEVYWKFQVHVERSLTDPTPVKGEPVSLYDAQPASVPIGATQSSVGNEGYTAPIWVREFQQEGSVIALDTPHRLVVGDVDTNPTDVHLIIDHNVNQMIYHDHWDGHPATIGDADNDNIPDSQEVRNDVYWFEAEAHYRTPQQLTVDAQASPYDHNYTAITSLNDGNNEMINTKSFIIIEKGTYHLFVRARKDKADTGDVGISLFANGAQSVPRLNDNYSWYSTPEFVTTTGYVNIAVFRSTPGSTIYLDRLMLVRTKDESGNPTKNVLGQVTDPLDNDVDRDGILDGYESRPQTVWYEAEEHPYSSSNDIIEDALASGGQAVDTYNGQTIAVPFRPPVAESSSNYDGINAVALWHFDFNARSSRIATGAEQNMPSCDLENMADSDWVENGIAGSAINIDGTTGSYLSCSDTADLDLSNSFSIDAWIYPHTLQPYGPFVMKKDSYAFQFGPDGIHLRGAIYQGFTWYAIDDTATDGRQVTFQVGRWYHVAFTYDGSHMILYVNGKAVETASFSVSANQNTLPVLLGKNPNGDYPYSGLLDEVRISKDVAVHFANDISIVYNVMVKARSDTEGGMTLDLVDSVTVTSIIDGSAHQFGLEDYYSFQPNDPSWKVTVECALCEYFVLASPTDVNKPIIVDQIVISDRHGIFRDGLQETTTGTEESSIDLSFNSAGDKTIYLTLPGTTLVSNASLDIKSDSKNNYDISWDPADADNHNPVQLQEHPDIWGNTVVWSAKDQGNHDQIYYYDTSVQINNVPAFLTGDNINLQAPLHHIIALSDSVEPAVDKNFIVFADDRHFANTGWDIYIYDMNLGRDFQLDKSAGDQRNPDINGSRVVWEDLATHNIYSYDLSMDSDGDKCPNWLERSGALLLNDYYSCNGETLLAANDHARRLVSVDPNDVYTHPHISDDKIVWTDTYSKNGVAHSRVQLFDFSLSSETVVDAKLNLPVLSPSPVQDMPG